MFLDVIEQGNLLMSGNGAAYNRDDCINIKCTVRCRRTQEGSAPSHVEGERSGPAAPLHPSTPSPAPRAPAVGTVLRNMAEPW